MVRHLASDIIVRILTAPDKSEALKMVYEENNSSANPSVRHASLMSLMQRHGMHDQHAEYKAMMGTQRKRGKSAPRPGMTMTVKASLVNEHDVILRINVTAYDVEPGDMVDIVFKDNGIAIPLQKKEAIAEGENEASESDEEANQDGSEEDAEASTEDEPGDEEVAP